MSEAVFPRICKDPVRLRKVDKIPSESDLQQLLWSACFAAFGSMSKAYDVLRLVEMSHALFGVMSCAMFCGTVLRGVVLVLVFVLVLVLVLVQGLMLAG